MKSSKIHTVPFRRKREGKTNYKKRIKLLLSSKPRLVIRRSLKYFVVQIVQYQPAGDKVLASAHSKELANLGWTFSCANTSAAYLVGYLLASKVKDIKEVTPDIGLYPSIPKSRMYAIIKGCIDGGLSLPFDEKILPLEERVLGKHIVDYATKLKEDKLAYDKQFSAYLKKNVQPEKIQEVFVTVKGAIQKGV